MKIRVRETYRMENRDLLLVRYDIRWAGMSYMVIDRLKDESDKSFKKTRNEARNTILDMFHKYNVNSNDLLDVADPTRDGFKAVSRMIEL